MQSRSIIQIVLTCPYNCEWSEIYSNRFGIKNFPCKHIVLSKEIEFDNITIPKMAIYKFQKPTIQIDLQYQNWEFKDNEHTHSVCSIL